MKVSCLVTLSFGLSIFSLATTAAAQQYAPLPPPGCAVPEGYIAITTPAQLVGINNPSGKYILCNDLEFASVATQPKISSCAEFGQFKGTLDGNNFTVRNLFLAAAGGAPSSSIQGVIGCTGEAARIENISFENLQMRTTATYVGGVVGSNSGGQLRNVRVSRASIYGKHYTGGIVGLNYAPGSVSSASFSGTVDTLSYDQYAGGAGLIAAINYSRIIDAIAEGDLRARFYGGGIAGFSYGLIRNSRTAGRITVTSDSAGGIAAYNGKDAVIDDCSSSATVTAPVAYAGGLVGFNGSGIVASSHASGAVTGGSTSYGVGGLIGWQSNGRTQNSYASGAVRGGSDVGGLIGSIGYSNVAHSYSIGTVTGTSRTGALVGSSYSGSAISCFYLQTSYSASALGTPKSAAELQQIATFAGWEISHESQNRHTAWVMADPGVAPGSPYPQPR